MIIFVTQVAMYLRKGYNIAGAERDVFNIVCQLHAMRPFSSIHIRDNEVSIRIYIHGRCFRTGKCVSLLVDSICSTFKVSETYKGRKLSFRVSASS